MASLDDLKKRISSVKSTQKITKAMKMVAAAKLRKAQENAERGRPYSEKMGNIILNLSRGLSDFENAPNPRRHYDSPWTEFTAQFNNSNKHKIFEYTLSFETTISCEDARQDQNVVALIESQVELSKRVIQHNTLPIMRRIKWLRRHKNYDDLNNLQAQISFSDQRLSKLIETIKPNIKREKRVNDDEWFKWNEGRIGIGKADAKSGSFPKKRFIVLPNSGSGFPERIASATKSSQLKRS